MKLMSIESIEKKLAYEIK